MIGPVELIKRHYKRDIDSFFHISVKNRYLFVQTPKVASSTLKKNLIALELAGTKIDPQQVGLHPDILRSVHIKPYQLPGGLLRAVMMNADYTRFCFVRNPFSRVLSAFLDKIVRCEAEGIVFRRSNEMADDAPLEFARFIDLLFAQKDNSQNWDPHWRPQFDLLRPDLINYELIGRLETFDEDFAKLNEMLGGILGDAVTATPHKTGATDQMAAHYTPELSQAVAEIYAQDFETFDYATD